MSAEPLRGLHVLVVDDDPVARRVVGGILAHGGALVTEADSADAAWLSLERVIPEAIVSGLTLGPAGPAFALLQRIRAMSSARARAVPIVALAHAHDHTPINVVLEAGFAGYIKTPLDPGQLCELIADVAEAHPRQEGREE